jgi:hypothetical protein
VNRVFFFGKELRVKMDYMEDIGKLEERLEAEILECSKFGVVVEGVVETERDAERSRRCRGMISEVSTRMEDKRVEGRELAKTREDIRFGALVDRILGLERGSPDFER